MNREMIQRAEAQDDLADAFASIGQDGLDAALRFLEAAEKTFHQLAMMPGIGERFPSARPELAGVRRIGISGFRKYQVSYGCDLRLMLGPGVADPPGGRGFVRAAVALGLGRSLALPIHPAPHPAITSIVDHTLSYRPIDQGIEVLRVLHGARDDERILGSDA